MKLHPIYIISGALHVSILFYIGIIFFLANGSGWSMEWKVHPNFTIIAYAFTAAAFMSAVLAFMAPRIFFRDLQAASDMQGPLFFDFSQVTPRIQSATVLRMALAESVAIYGFVLAIVNQSPKLILPFALAGLTIQIFVGPFKPLLTGK